MKKLILLLLLIILLVVKSLAQGTTPIKFNVNTDPFTGQKIKCQLTGIEVDGTGKVTKVTYLLLFSNVTTDVPFVPTTDIQKTVTTTAEYSYVLTGKSILSTTLVYSPLTDVSGNPITNAIMIDDYLQLKANNTLPGVANGDPTWKVWQGIIKQIIIIKQANAELP